MSFDAVPVLDLSRARDPSAKPTFLHDLRRALLEVGFLYISNTGIGEELTANVIKTCHAFFDLPEEAKLAIEMKKAPSFLGTLGSVKSPAKTPLHNAAHQSLLS